MSTSTCNCNYFYVHYINILCYNGCSAGRSYLPMMIFFLYLVARWGLWRMTSFINHLCYADYRCMYSCGTKYVLICMRHTYVDNVNYLHYLSIITHLIKISSLFLFFYIKIKTPTTEGCSCVLDFVYMSQYHVAVNMLCWEQWLLILFEIWSYIAFYGVAPPHDLY